MDEIKKGDYRQPENSEDIYGSEVYPRLTRLTLVCRVTTCTCIQVELAGFKSDKTCQMDEWSRKLMRFLFGRKKCALVWPHHVGNRRTFKTRLEVVLRKLTIQVVGHVEIRAKLDNLHKPQPNGLVHYRSARRAAPKKNGVWRTTVKAGLRQSESLIVGSCGARKSRVLVIFRCWFLRANWARNNLAFLTVII